MTFEDEMKAAVAQQSQKIGGITGLHGGQAPKALSGSYSASDLAASAAVARKPGPTEAMISTSGNVDTLISEIETLHALMVGDPNSDEQREVVVGKSHENVADTICSLSQQTDQKLDAARAMIAEIRSRFCGAM